MASRAGRARRPRARRRDRHRDGRLRAGRALRLRGGRPRPERATCSARARAKLAADPALAQHIDLVPGEAERLPFGDGEFDALTFTYLLRYVDDPAATMRELARVVRPGGTIASLEFAVPRAAVSGAVERSTRGSGCRRSGGWRRATGTRSAASSGRASRASIAAIR